MGGVVYDPIGLGLMIAFLGGVLIFLVVDYVNWRRRWRAWRREDAVFRARLDEWRRQDERGDS